MGKLFGADGIRGVVSQTPLVSDDLERIGRAMAMYLFEQETSPNLLIAHDTRESCTSILRPLLFGLRASGIRVVDVGILPTPGVSYLTRRFGFSAGIMVSASHNPIAENGIKIFASTGHKLSEQQEARIEEFFFSGAPLPIRPTYGRMEHDTPLSHFYVNSLLADMPDVDWSHVPVMIDCAHGAASDIAAQIVQQLNMPAILLHSDPDGTNANELSGSEHLRRYPEQMAGLLRQEGRMVAVAFDGDADRAVFVDADGQLFNGDAVLAILALDLQRRKSLPHNGLVTTPARNTALHEHLQRRDIHVLETHRSGDKYVVELMEQGGYTLGGEQIGHTILLDETHVTGDGVRTALQIMRLMAENRGLSLFELSENFRRCPQVVAGATIPRQAHVPNADAIPGVADLKQQAWSSLGGLLRLETRFASTEPLLRVMLESSAASSVSELAWWARRIGAQAQHELGYEGFPIEVLDCSGGGLILA